MITITTPVSVTPSTKSISPGSKGPLETLYNNAMQFDTLMYPDDLGSDTKNHYVQIYIKNVKPASYDIKSGVNKTINVVKDGKISVTASDLAKKFLSSAVEIAQSNFNFNLNFDAPVTDTVAVISLYMPDTMQSIYGATYDTISITGDLGAGVRGVQAVAAGAGDISKNFNGGGNASSVAPATITLLSSILGTAADKIGINLQNIGDLLIKGQGFGINPQLQMIYRGTNFRSFQLSFMFSPKSEDEAETVDAIINTLRYHFAPTLANGGVSSNDSMFLIPPSIFNVVFKLKSNENKFLPKYGDCVLESIDVDNAPNGSFVAYDRGPKGRGEGAPIQTRLTLQFKEIVIVERGLMKQGSVR